MKVRVLPILFICLSLGLSLRISKIINHAKTARHEGIYIDITPRFINNAEAAETEADEEESKADVEELNGVTSYSEAPQEVEHARDLKGNNSGDQIVSNEELRLLKNLAERKEKILEFEKSLKLKEKLLLATENNIDKKIKKLENIKLEVENLLNKYETGENSKLKSLVKIYESMGAKDAAKIFEDLDMRILLRIMMQMKEAKVASILANMDPKKARDISTEFAKKQKLANL